MRDRTGRRAPRGSRRVVCGPGVWSARRGGDVPSTDLATSGQAGRIAVSVPAADDRDLGAPGRHSGRRGGSTGSSCPISDATAARTSAGDALVRPASPPDVGRLVRRRAHQFVTTALQRGAHDVEPARAPRSRPRQSRVAAARSPPARRPVSAAARRIGLTILVSGSWHRRAMDRWTPRPIRARRRQCAAQAPARAAAADVGARAPSSWAKSARMI